MYKISPLFLILTYTVFSGCSKDLLPDKTAPAYAKDLQPANSARIAELDDYWAEVSRCVNEGDFEGYKATCHEDGVFVSGAKNEAYPLSQALERWKQDFTDTYCGRIKARVEFRFRQRLGDKTTAHETGMFRYARVNADGTKTKYYIHLEALLIKRGAWKIVMEYQKSEGTENEWNQLK